MTWWDDEHKVDDDKIAHPADCSQWQAFNDKHKDFSQDPRNVRFGLSTDGMNLFNKRMSDHSTWPVILTMYNLPMYSNVFVSEEKVPFPHYSCKELSDLHDFMVET
jgi:hypothetical protein